MVEFIGAQPAADHFHQQIARAGGDLRIANLEAPGLDQSRLSRFHELAPFPARWSGSIFRAGAGLSKTLPSK